MSKEPTLCKKCKSPRVLYVRIDEDWGHGGAVTRLNDDSYYEKDDREDSDDRPDIAIVHCEACGHQEG